MSIKTKSDNLYLQFIDRLLTPALNIKCQLKQFEIWCFYCSVDDAALQLRSHSQQQSHHLLGNLSPAWHKWDDRQNYDRADRADV